MLKVALFGASGGTGRLIVDKALEAGHEVRALVRKPSRLALTHPRLALVEGDVRDAAKVAETISGANSVLSAIGPVRGDPPGLMRVLADNLLAGMQAAAVRRLVYITGAGMVQPEDPPALAPRILLPLMKLLAREVLEDSRAGVERIKASDRDWIIVRAPRLDDSPPRGAYRAGYIKPTLAALSRADLADFVIRQLTSDEYLRKLPIVSN